MTVSALAKPPSRLRLQAEFVLFYVLAPVLVAVLLPASAMFPALFALTVLGMLLLQATRGFHWRDLVPRRVPDWRLVGTFTGAVLAICLLVIHLFAPGQAFSGRRSTFCGKTPH